MSTPLLSGCKATVGRMDRLDRLGWTGGLCFTSFGARIGIRVNEPACLERLPHHLPPLSEQAAALMVDKLYSLHVAAGSPEHACRRFHRRQSIRAYGERPISDRQLAEFLYRTARVADYRESSVNTRAGPIRMAFAPRPYPAGGCLHELELYVAINACENLAPGLYSYDSEDHRLIRLSGRTEYVEQMLSHASQSAGVPVPTLQVLIVIAARFPRIAWKYQSIAYSLTLKNVGVLYQTMYLVATAMNLAPCGIGAGDSDRFARAAGTDY